MYIQFVGILKANTYLLQFQECPHQKLFFHLQESEDERRARVNEKYRERPRSLFNGNHFISLVIN